MAFKKEGISDIPKDTEAWNVADGFSKIKILRHLIQLDRYDTIAQFGTEDLDQDMMLDDASIKRRRVEALERFISTLRQLLGNVQFVLKKEGKETIKRNFPILQMIQDDFLKSLYKVRYDHVMKEEKFEINEKLFKHILNVLQKMKDEINSDLNSAGLIFRESDEVDLDKIMQDIIDGG